jgi:hypothetical protein
VIGKDYIQFISVEKVCECDPGKIQWPIESARPADERKKVCKARGTQDQSMRVPSTPGESGSVETEW